MSMLTATSVATRSGRRAAARAAIIAPIENPATTAGVSKRSHSIASSRSVSLTIVWMLRSRVASADRSERPQPRWSQ